LMGIILKTTKANSESGETLMKNPLELPNTKKDYSYEIDLPVLSTLSDKLIYVMGEYFRFTYGRNLNYIDIKY
jgi:hypothetical protein